MNDSGQAGTTEVVMDVECSADLGEGYEVCGFTGEVEAEADWYNAWWQCPWCGYEHTEKSPLTRTRR